MGPATSLPSPPDRFPFPFNYAPDALARRAADDLRAYLEGPRDWTYDFGIHTPGGTGKMFGVLVVEAPAGELGYLAGYSGKLTEGDRLPGFVPPVFDLLRRDGHYRRREADITAMNQRIAALENDPELASKRAALAELATTAERELAAGRAALSKAKKIRRQRRQAAKAKLPRAEYDALIATLAEESMRRQLEHKNKGRAFQHQLRAARAALAAAEEELTTLRNDRRTASRELQDWLFRQYDFLNARGQRRDLLDIFRETAFGQPMSGAGDCAAPKLLQYAYLNGLRPVTMAEFWWGRPPEATLRRHGYYYPACRGKCAPILGHMLNGLAVDPDPLARIPAADSHLDVVYEDEDILLVNKPAGLLSVPGKTVVDSVQDRLHQRYPRAIGPLIVHRLDLATSGLLLCAKHSEAHRHLQQQFLQRSIKKRYRALLDGTLAEGKGTVTLPLRQDILDRPRQVVDHNGGKPAQTRWRTLEVKEGRTLVHFWPLTGRTHQLRVHAAHHRGLNTPIVGDRLYGKRDERMYLQAEWIEFEHPTHGRRMSVSLPPDF